MTGSTVFDKMREARIDRWAHLIGFPVRILYRSIDTRGNVVEVESQVLILRDLGLSWIHASTTHDNDAINKVGFSTPAVIDIKRVHRTRP